MTLVKSDCKIVRDIKARQHDDDLRPATLEQQVDSLQDAATQSDISSKAVAAENEKRVRKYAWIAALGSLVVKWAVALITRKPLP
jgi:hypothetical protein